MGILQPILLMCQTTRLRPLFRVLAGNTPSHPRWRKFMNMCAYYATAISILEAFAYPRSTELKQVLNLIQWTLNVVTSS